MGRFIKNLQLKAGSYAIRLPIGTNALGPQYPQDGQLRFNSETDQLQIYYGNSWKGTTAEGRVAIVKDEYTGDGMTVSWPITNTYDAGHEAEMIVFIGNVYQNPGVAYTVSGYEITFTSTPDFDMPIVILHNFNSTHVQ
jgi:hypothetical protein